MPLCSKQGPTLNGATLQRGFKKTFQKIHRLPERHAKEQGANKRPCLFVVEYCVRAKRLRAKRLRAKHGSNTGYGPAVDLNDKLPETDLCCASSLCGVVFSTGSGDRNPTPRRRYTHQQRSCAGAVPWINQLRPAGLLNVVRRDSI